MDRTTKLVRDLNVGDIALFANDTHAYRVEDDVEVRDDHVRLTLVNLTTADMSAFDVDYDLDSTADVIDYTDLAAHEDERLTNANEALHRVIGDRLPVRFEPISMGHYVTVVHTTYDQAGRRIMADIDWDDNDRPWCFWDDATELDGMKVMPNTTPIGEVADAFIEWAKKTGGVIY